MTERYAPRGVAAPMTPPTAARTRALPPSRKGQGGATPRTHCPHCDSPTAIRSTRRFHNTYREITYQCQNIECSCTFVAGLEVIRITSPSGIPNPRLRLSTKPREVPDEVIAIALEDGHQTGPPPDADPEPASLALPF